MDKKNKTDKPGEVPHPHPDPEIKPLVDPEEPLPEPEDPKDKVTDEEEEEKPAYEPPPVGEGP